MSKPFNSFFDTTRIKFNELYSDAITNLKQLYPKYSSQTFSLSSPFGQLLTVLVNLGRMILYFVEDSINELNINNAIRQDSIRSLITLTGHNPSRPISPKGKIKIKYNGKSLEYVNSSIFITNKSELVSNNGLVYTLIMPTEDMKISTSSLDSEIVCNIYQGQLDSQQATGNGEPLQSFNFKQKRGSLIDQYFVNVYVNGELWTKVESLYDMPFESKNVIVKTGGNGGIDIFFGNGFNGYIPPMGSTIVVEYLTTVGIDGEIQKSSISDVWKLKSNGYINNVNMDINDYIDISLDTDIAFGTDAEPIVITRMIAPFVSRSMVLANKINYKVFFQKMNRFQIIETFNGSELVSIDSNKYNENKVYIFLVPKISNKISITDDYFSISKDIMILDENEKEAIYTFIEESGQRIITLENEILTPDLVYFGFDIKITMFKGYDQTTIKNEIRKSISEYILSNTRQDTIPLSDFYALIESIDGVDSANIKFVSDIQNKNVYNNYYGIDEYGDIILNKQTSTNIINSIQPIFRSPDGKNYLETITGDKYYEMDYTSDNETISKRIINITIIEK